MKSSLIIFFLFCLVGITSGQTNNRDSIYVELDVLPEFPGGMDSMRAFIAHHIIYPKAAIELGLEGICYVQFDIDTLGKVANIRVKRHVPDCPECDKEAVRVIRIMPAWSPGKKDDTPVNCTMILPVKFELISGRKGKKRKKER